MTARSNFERSVAILNAGRLGRVLRQPIKLINAKLMVVIASRTHKTYAKKATLFWGETINIICPDTASIDIYRFGFYEEGLTRAIMNYLGPGMEFIDIGANIGYYTMLAAWLVESQGHVHAFEPTPATYSVLESNAGGRLNVHLNNSAVSSSDGNATFYDFGAALFGRNSVHRHALPRDPERIYQVPMITIDNYVQAQGASPNLIKIDAEHSELAIIHGMEETLRVHRPAVSLEVGDLDIPGVPPSRELVAAMVSNGYKVFTSTVAGLIPHVAYDRYSYDNLIFLPAERATT